MHPTLFHLPTPFGDMPVYAYGTMLGLSILFGWYAMQKTGSRFGIEPDVAGNAYALAVFLALVGARLGFALADPSLLRMPAELVSPKHGGLAAASGLALAGLGLVWIARRHGVPFLRLLDASAPAMALGIGLTRIGCYLYGCDYGIRFGSSAPGFLQRLGTFPRWSDATGVHGSPVFLRQLGSAGSTLDLDASHALPVHPTQLYESLFGFVLLGVSIFLVRRAERAGDVFLPCAIAYGAGRLLIEPLRGDPERGLLGPVSVPQIMSVLLIIAAAALLATRSRRPPDAPSGDEPHEPNEVQIPPSSVAGVHAER